MKTIKLVLAATLFSLLAACNSEAPQKELEDTKDANSVVETISARRSIRKYKLQAISRDTMQIILNAGINAPNGKGIQSWQVRVVDNRALLDSMSNISGKKLSKDIEIISKANMFYNAPVVAFIAYDTGYDLSQVDCGLLGENMILTAQSMGIGSCCLGAPARFLNTNPEASQYLKKLDFPETHKLLYCIAFGYPDESPDAKPRDMNKVKFID